MKITTAHLQTLQELKGAYLRTIAQSQSAVWHATVEDMRKNPKIKDTHEAARWHLARAAGMLNHNILAAMYNYMDDNHINTALRYVWDIE